MCLDGLLTMLADKRSRPSMIVTDMCAQTSVLLMDVLKTKYNLFECFEGFRNYMLLGRGDFYNYVISKLECVFITNEKNRIDCFLHDTISISDSISVIK